MSGTATATTTANDLAEMKAELERLRVERYRLAQEHVESGVITQESAYQMISELGLTDAQREVIVKVGMGIGWKFVGRTIAGWSLERIQAGRERRG